jgi:TRAP transporter 4TM/12TM fusion protein
MSADSTGSYERLRHPKKGWPILVKLIGVVVPILGCLYILRVHTYLGISLYPQQFGGLILGLLLVLSFVLKPATKSNRQDVVPWYDIIAVIITFALTFYLAFLYPTEAGLHLSYIKLHKVILGALAVIAVLEATRRLVGWPLVILVIVSILYGRYNEALPGQLAAAGIPWDRLAVSLFLDPGAMLGIPMTIGTTMLFGFLLFGSYLMLCGGGEFITDISLALMGKYRGGPAKVAVVASGLFGTLSGSAVANAVTVGMVTIPMMKKAGYKPEFAAAVEGAASAGGTIMPPVMGATAFMMAEFLGITYAQVCIAAAVPAVLYYMCLLMQVDLEAAKSGIKGLAKGQLPSATKSMAKGWLTAIAIFVLMYSLFVSGLTPERSALYGAASVLICSFLGKETRLNFKRFISGLEFTTTTMLEVITVCAAAGLIIGVVMQTGIGTQMSTMLVDLSGGNVMVLLILTAVVSIIMGMGMPGIISYILLAVLVVPALIELGVNPLASHLFIIYYGVMSFITPPVCIAIYVTAAIAGTSINKAGLRACLLGITAYLVPFVIVFDEGLVLSGTAMGVAWSVAKAVPAFMLLAVVVEGYFLARLSIVKRILACAGAAALLIPVSHWTGWVANLAGLCIAILLLVHELHRKRHRPSFQLEHTTQR